MAADPRTPNAATTEISFTGMGVSLLGRGPPRSNVPLAKWFKSVPALRHRARVGAATMMA
jgi:hypothetical protein